MVKPLFLFLGLLFLLLSCREAARTPEPPATKKVATTETLFGETINDPYRWLENHDKPEVVEWIKAQNGYTDRLLHSRPDWQKIHARLKTLFEIGYVTAPTVTKNRLFYLKREGAQNQPLLIVREGAEGKERVLLDVNALNAAGTTALDWFFPSPDGTLLAYGISDNGSENSVCHIMKVDTGEEMEETIGQTRACSIAWLPDDSGFYYTRYPKRGSMPEGEEEYHRRVYVHKMGTDPDNDPLLFGEKREKTDWPNLTISPDGRTLIVNVSKGWTRSDLYLYDTKRKRWTTIVEGEDAVFNASVYEGKLFIHTNWKAPNYRLLAASLRHPTPDNWREIIPEDKNAVLQDVTYVSGTLVADRLTNVHSQLLLYDTKGKALGEVTLPTLGSVGGVDGWWEGKSFYFSFTSFFIPTQVYRVALPATKPEMLYETKCPVDTSAFTVEQKWATSRDGTKIPLFLLHGKEMKRNGNNPTILYGYGGFNVSLTPAFRRNVLLFLEKGGVYALANLRGGGEFGEAWHRAGMREKKQNVFDDFIACAEYLEGEKITSTKRLAIMGGSNGGLLVGAVLVQRPDLFQAVICQVPLLDMVHYPRFKIAQLWMDEYGNPAVEKDFKTLYAYSPYHHVREGTAYPAVLLTTALHDTRVDSMHAMKMAARLQAATISVNPILLRVETHAGHGQGKPLSMALDEYTDYYAFLFRQLGMERAP